MTLAKDFLADAARRADAALDRLLPPVEGRLLPPMEARLLPPMEARLLPPGEARLLPPMEARLLPPMEARLLPPGEARLLPPGEASSARLHEAMRYSALSPGKRLRPALALAACRAFGGDEEACVAPAAALEMIHAYSLIHDDLPAMDDDDLRRGMPTCHIAFGEAMAILAGDGLHTLACEVLATYPEGDAWLARRARAQVHVLQAIGWRGMVGGQAVDIELTGRGGAASEEDVRGIHLRKTAALIRASLLLGAELGGADAAQVEEVARLGDTAGLAFQVVDDVLDVTTDAATLGKTQGKDAEEGKVTYPAVLGLEGARREAERLCAEALDTLAAIRFPASGDPAPLEALTRFILSRTS